VVREPLRPQPDWPRIHAELRRPGVTLLLLWEEYRAGQPEGYGYSRFCDLYREAGASPMMRQTHVVGEPPVLHPAAFSGVIVDDVHEARDAAGVERLHELLQLDDFVSLF
jgi:transposase